MDEREKDIRALNGISGVGVATGVVDYLLTIIDGLRAEMKKLCLERVLSETWVNYHNQGVANIRLQTRLDELLEAAEQILPKFEGWKSIPDDQWLTVNVGDLRKLAEIIGRGK